MANIQEITNRCRTSLHLPSVTTSTERAHLVASAQDYGKSFLCFSDRHCSTCFHIYCAHFHVFVQVPFKSPYLGNFPTQIYIQHFLGACSVTSDLPPSVSMTSVKRNPLMSLSIARQGRQMAWNITNCHTKQQLPQKKKKKREIHSVRSNISALQRSKESKLPVPILNFFGPV